MTEIRYCLIDAKAMQWRLQAFDDLHHAKIAVGLDPHKVDHGTLYKGLAYVVYEFGFFVPPPDQHYFRIGKTLIAGNCVLYGYDERGDTVDVPAPPAMKFYGNKTGEIELDIRNGLAFRPRHTVQGAGLWQWPDPAPAHLRAALKEHGL